MSGSKRGSHRRSVCTWAGAALVLAALAVAGPAHAVVAGAGGSAPPLVPALASPADDAVLDALPTFAWQPAAGADRYEFEIAADPGFNSPVLGAGLDQFQTRNTRATLKKTVPNGSYYWHVRSVSRAGEVSGWSPTRSFRHAWLVAPTLLAPVNGAPVVHPSPLTLRWTPVPRAKGYIVSVATDPELGSLVGGRTLETVATTFSYSGVLAPGRYYWGVTPLDGGDHRGAPSAVGSFTWSWPSSMARAPRVADFADQHAEIFDPNFSWDPVPGAASYQVEVWSSDQPDLKVCCDGTSIGTSLAPTLAFKDNTYFWRVRALDAGGHAGDWNDGPTFRKAFAAAQVQNLRMRDHVSDPGTDLVPGAGGYQTEVPIVAWDPVPGASSYDVEVAPFQHSPADPSQPPRCNWTATSSHWTTITATTAWTPLGAGWNFQKPYSDPMNVSNDFSTGLVVGASYCVRVRPRDVDSSLLGRVLYGDYTYLNSAGPAFQWTGYPAGTEDCTPWPDCDDGYLRGDFYVGPSDGATTTGMPLFTWRPLAGKRSYFVLVAKDPSFHTIVDYAFTQVPAYAPRTAFSSTTYQDETTHYYWAVLPAVEPNGNFASGDPMAAAPHSFQKMSTQPTLRAPTNGADVTQHPTFHWTPVEGVRRYRLEVSQEPTFRTVLEDNCGCGAVVTDSTGYTPKTTYPADTVLYWRVRGEDDRLQAMVWSATGTFQRRLPGPAPSSGNPLSGDLVPAVTWSPVDGAVSYDFDVDQPDGTHRFFTGLQAGAFTPSYIYGTGIWRWRVRANFAKAGFGVIPGPYTDFVRFTRTLREPPGQATSASPTHVVLSWQPKDGPGNGVQGYRVQVSTRPDFSALVEDERTENTSYAPALTNFLYAQGGTFYWRVASTDGGRNTGDFTGTQSFTLPAKETTPVPPPPPARTASRTSARVSKTRNALRIVGTVSPAHRGRVSVTLLRRRSRGFVRVATKRPALSARSAYATSFARPRRGRCRVTVRFAGDADHLPSAATVTFAC